MQNDAIYLMKEALELARKAYVVGEVPVGAVIFNHKTKQIISQTHNMVEANNNPCLHAEILAINEATKIMGNKFINDCDIFVSLEPCPMCAHAISLAKIRRLYFAAYDKKDGAVEHGAKIYNASSCNHKPEIYGGILEEGSAKLLKDFFSNLRL